MCERLGFVYIFLEGFVWVVDLLGEKMLNLGSFFLFLFSFVLFILSRKRRKKKDFLSVVSCNHS